MSEAGGDNQAVIEPAGFTPLGSQSNSDGGRKPYGPRLLIAALLILFVLLLAFLLQARSVQLKVLVDTSARIDVSGLALPLGERYLLRPGNYPLQIDADGYETLTTSLQISSESNQYFEFALQPLPGRLSISSDPAGATVILDGKRRGETPIEKLQLSAGEHVVAVEKARHLPHHQTLQITGRNITQQLHLELQPAWANVSVSSKPDGAQILVDGAPRGNTPLTLQLLQGQRQLTLRAPGYAQLQKNLVVQAGTAQHLDSIILQPAAGNLALSSTPGGANVTLDGEFQGQTPLLLELSPGTEQQLAVFKPGYRRHVESLTATAGSRQERTIALQPLLGSVRFTITPADAQLHINGTAHGTGTRILSLPAVEHEATIRLQGYATQRHRFTPRPGLEQEVVVHLQTAEEARLARLKPRIVNSLGQTMLLFNPAATTFSMGASRREPGRQSNEVLRPVKLERLFYLQTTEVTNAQFRQFQADHKSGQVKSRSLNRDKQPAVELSWQQAASFCNWLSRREGLAPFYRERQGIVVGFDPRATGYRLPTEAEWAWAARSDDKTLLRFPWGDAFPPTDPVENYADKASAFITGRVLNNYTDAHVVSAPVGSYPANQHGLYDMGGNVAEWVHDVYSIPAPDSPVTTDPLGPQRGDNYVIRGASWSHAKLPDLRLAHRDYGQAGRDDVGFRLARYAE